MQIADYIAEVTGLSIQQLFMATPLVVLSQDSVGHVTITHWDASLPTQPTANQIIAALAAPPAPAALLAYANAKANALMAVARTYALAGSAAVSVKCDTTPSTGSYLAGLNLWGAASPTSTTKWVDDFGVATTITGAQGVALATAVVAYGQTVFNELGTATTEVLSGAITTTAQIDALTWPT